MTRSDAYRLPSDHEWSCAVGIGDREDPAKTPHGNDQRITDEFPWSGVASAGGHRQLLDEELRPLLAVGKFPEIKGELAGYQDGFAMTAPVGSYRPSHFGLYDLGGNVREWCQESFSETQRQRVFRGGSFKEAVRAELLSSKRMSTHGRCRKRGTTPASASSSRRCRNLPRSGSVTWRGNGSPSGVWRW